MGSGKPEAPVGSGKPEAPVGSGRHSAAHLRHRARRTFQFAQDWQLPGPPDAVFALLADPDGYPQWWPQVRQLSQGANPRLLIITIAFSPRALPSTSAAMVHQVAPGDHAVGHRGRPALLHELRRQAIDGVESSAVQGHGRDTRTPAGA